MNGELFSTHKCPRCKSKLEKVQTIQGEVSCCHKCGGRAIGIGLLKKISDQAKIQEVWSRAKQENNRTGVPCPACQLAMLVVVTPPELGSVELDICHSCFLIWFDQQELEKVQKVHKTLNAAAAKKAIAEHEGLRSRYNKVINRRVEPNNLRNVINPDYREDQYLLDVADLILFWVRGK